MSFIWIDRDDIGAARRVLVALPKDWRGEAWVGAGPRPHLFQLGFGAYFGERGLPYYRVFWGVGIVIWRFTFGVGVRRMNPSAGGHAE